MTNTMKSHSLYEQRDRDIISLCRSLLISSCMGEIQSLRELATAAVACGAPRYYVDVAFAYRRILLMRQGAALPRRRETKRMWEEIIHKVLALQRGSPSLSLRRALIHILMREPASGFFLEIESMIKILQKYNRDNKKDRFYFQV